MVADIKSSSVLGRYVLVLFVGCAGYTEWPTSLMAILMPSDDAVTVTGARWERRAGKCGGPRATAAVEKGSISLWRTRVQTFLPTTSLPSTYPNADHITKLKYHTDLESEPAQKRFYDTRCIAPSNASFLSVLDMLEIGWVQYHSLKLPIVFWLLEDCPRLLGNIASIGHSRIVVHRSSNNDQSAMHAFGFEFLM